MSTIHNLKKYKEAVSILPDIEVMIKILSLTETSLNYYNHYLPAHRVASIAREQKKMLEIYKKELTEIKDSKGKRINDI